MFFETWMEGECEFQFLFFFFFSLGTPVFVNSLVTGA